MRRGFHGGPQWWPEGEQWPPRRGRGYEEWSGFGRRIFAGFMVIVGLFFLIAALVGAVIATGVAGLADTERIGVVGGSVLVLIIGCLLLGVLVFGDGLSLEAVEDADCISIRGEPIGLGG